MVLRNTNLLSLLINLLFQGEKTGSTLQFRHHQTKLKVPSIFGIKLAQLLYLNFMTTLNSPATTLQKNYFLNKSVIKESTINFMLQ